MTSCTLPLQRDHGRGAHIGYRVGQPSAGVRREEVEHVPVWRHQNQALQCDALISKLVSAEFYNRKQFIKEYSCVYCCEQSAIFSIASFTEYAYNIPRR